MLKSKPLIISMFDKVELTGRKQILPKQQLQLRVEEPNQRPSAENLGVAISQSPSVFIQSVGVQTLCPRGQRHNLG